jgi:hypothetical protein
MVGLKKCRRAGGVEVALGPCTRGGGYGGAIHCLGVVRLLSRTAFEVLMRHQIRAYKASLEIYSVTTCIILDYFDSMLDSYW